MKSKLILFSTIIAIFILPISSLAESFGPDNWHQYRLNSDKNAVFDNGSEPLEELKLKTADEIRATPVVVGNKLYVGNHNSGDLFAFDLTTGEQLWNSKAPNWIHSEMIYNEGTLYVGFGNRYFQDNGIRGTGESGVLAVDAETGEEVWKFNTEGEVMPTPAYKDGYVYAATGDKHLYKIDAETGEQVHQEELGSTVSMSSPNITGDTLYVGGSGPKPYMFYAYDLENDSIKWKTPFKDVVAGLDDVPVAVSDNIAITTAVEGSYEDPNHKIYALDTETGEINWEDSFGKGDMVKNNKSGAPIIYEGNVYVGSPITKTFYAYDLKTGERLWTFKDEVMKAPPVAKDGIVYFTNTVGVVNALDAETGELLNSKELGGTLAPSGPIIINDTLIVGSQDSNVYVVPLNNIVNSIQNGDEEPSESNETSEEEVAPDADNNYLWYAVLIILAIAVVAFIMKRKK
ncbi:outer membrane protein assembly factor BamB family protein [Piscibacillus salipiscarius]|uniref:PQQ-binding-like beta-propeller repeat protein n=1 Tax=Piscibacillus salipiscarius TaxID=299480 RepID=A0ABW5Q6S3_9BACI|nr:PQQ-binding-like beta-propeller repeat protein [Piscibacillus salipiscarius]